MSYPSLHRKVMHQKIEEWRPTNRRTEALWQKRIDRLLFWGSLMVGSAFIIVVILWVFLR